MTASMHVFLVSLVSLLWSCDALTTLVNRRQLLDQSAAAVTGASFGFLSNKNAASASDDDFSAAPSSVPRDKAVLILGANGQTGRECVQATLARGRPCLATSRSGIWMDTPTQNANLLSTAVADVTSLASLQAAVQSYPKEIGAVIFAASVSSGKKRPESFAVDRDGAIHAAQCCLANQIPRLVVVSSGCVTRPDSAVYKLLNFAGSGIMEAKIQGEDAVRELYASPDALKQGLGYTVVRPGGLTSAEPLGASEMELHQGDSKSGRLSRADVAALCLEALDSSDTFDTTFECYEKDTAKPIESVGFSNIMKSTDPTTVVTGRERRGDDYPNLFRGLARDPGHLVV